MEAVDGVDAGAHHGVAVEEVAHAAVLRPGKRCQRNFAVALTIIGKKCAYDSFSTISAYFQIMRREFCVFCVEPLQPAQGSWLVPLEPPKSPKRGPF